MANLLNQRVSAKKMMFFLIILFGFHFVVQRLEFEEGHSYIKVHQDTRGCGIPNTAMTSLQLLGENATKVPPSEDNARLETCGRFGQTVNASKLPELTGMDHIYVVDRFKLLFCYVPKVACTNWKRILMILQGNLDIKQHVSHMDIHRKADVSLRALAHLKPVERKNVMNYTKIMFVRDPFARLLSAYRDKLEKSGGVDSDRFRRLWVKKMRGRDGRPPQSRTEDVTFEEFTSYLADPVNTLDIGDEEHWRPIHRLCKPCAIKYDFVGRFERLERDSHYALNDLLHSNFTGGLMNSTNFTNSSDIALINKYFSRLGIRTLEGLYKRYQLDFELFGYPSLEEIIGRLLSTTNYDSKAIDERHTNESRPLD